MLNNAISYHKPYEYTGNPFPRLPCRPWGKGGTSIVTLVSPTWQLTVGGGGSSFVHDCVWRSANTFGSRVYHGLPSCRSLKLA